MSVQRNENRVRRGCYGAKQKVLKAPELLLHVGRCVEFGRVFNHVIRRTGNSVDLAPDPPIAAAEKGGADTNNGDHGCVALL
jgi:hypothetical protein